MTKVPDLTTMTPENAMLAWRQWQADTGKWAADFKRPRNYNTMYAAAFNVGIAINSYGTLYGSQAEGAGRKILAERLAEFETAYASC